MPENENPIQTNDNQPKPAPAFVTKPVDKPFLDTEAKAKLTGSPAPEAVASGLKGFYLSNKYYIWAIALGLIIIAVLAFFAFRKAPVVAPTSAAVEVSVDAPDTVPSGGEIVYKIKIENKDKDKLTGIQLELVYPDGTTYVSSNPAKASNLSGTLFAIPDLRPGDNVVVFVKAQVNGGINDTKELGLKLHYKFANFSSEFVKEQRFSVRIVASNVVFEITGPDKTNNAQLVTYTLNYKNNSQQDIKNSQVTISYPDGFEFGTSDPQPSRGNNVWNVDSLPVGGQGTISVSGSFRSAQPGESKTISAVFSTLGNDGQPKSQAQTEFVTAIASVPLLVSEELTDSSKTIVNPGDTVQIQIKYQNNASVPVTGANILVSLDSKALDLSTIQAEGAQVSNNTILWNASSNSSLENLAPSNNGTLRFSVQVKNPATRDSSKNLTVISSVKMKSNEYDYFPGNDITIKIASLSSLSADLAYASGNLPPQIGKQTSYKVTLTLKNATNDYSDGILTAFIPLGPSGFDQSSISGTEASKVSYDSSTGKLTWNVGALPAHTGDFKPPRTLGFTVKITPVSSQAGKNPTLIKDIKFQGKDTFTEQDISLSAEDLTTSDASGSDGYSQGYVTQ